MLRRVAVEEKGKDIDKDVSQLLKMLLGPLKEVEPISLLSSPPNKPALR